MYLSLIQQLGSAAGPEVNLFRDITGADGNYLGQIKFKGKNDNNNEKNYAKITGKISDASNGTEDGLLEFATIKDGSQSIRARLTSTNFKLLNNAGIEVDGTAYVSSTTDIDGTLRLNNATTALTTDLTSAVGVKLDQLNSVNIAGLESDHLLVYDGTNWVNEYPMHTYIRIRNDESTVTIEAGDAVYVKGTHNVNILNVGLAQSDSATTMPCIGLSNQRLTVGQTGTAVAYGKALKVVTTGFIEGETVYVSNTVPGGLSNVKPFNNDLIQNIGVVTKIHHNNGAVFVTGIGRANDIPNAAIVLDESDINYVYVNNVNNDLKKIEPANLLTQLQTFEQVSAAGNTVSNVIAFNNTTTGLVTVANVDVGSNISIAGPYHRSDTNRRN